MESVSSFILVMATVILGLVTFSLFASYGAITYANTISLQQAQQYAAGLRIVTGKPVSNIVPVIINNYAYNGPIYIVVFYSPYNNPNYIPSKVEYGIINWTKPLLSNVKILTLNNEILYEGSIQYYKTYSGNIQFVQIKPGYYTILWVIVNNYQIGYEVIKG